jgi:AraC family transcriptional regulator
MTQLNYLEQSGHRRDAVPRPFQQRERGGRNHALHVRSVERVISAMKERLDSPMSNEEMAEIACFSSCHFNRLFHKLTGVPPIQFHYALRLERAKQLLISTDLCITEICFEVGYNSLGSFVSRFSKLVGLAPNSYRRYARQVASAGLIDLRPIIAGMNEGVHAEGSVDGLFMNAPQFDGVAVIGIYRRALPEGPPAACSVAMCDDTSYRVALPHDGPWFAMSIALPWTASGMQLLTLEGLPRGRSGLICNDDGRWLGDSAICLSWPHRLDPPILATLPLLLGQAFADIRDSSGPILPFLSQPEAEWTAHNLSISKKAN